MQYLRGVGSDFELTTNENRWERITTTRHEPQGPRFARNVHQKPDAGRPGVQLDVCEDDPGLEKGGE